MNQTTLIPCKIIHTTWISYFIDHDSKVIKKKLGWVSKDKIVFYGEYAFYCCELKEIWQVSPVGSDTEIGETYWAINKKEMNKNG